MRPIPSFFAVVATLATLTGCGTKTPLSLPQPAPAVTPAPTPAVDNSNKAAVEPGR